jgi:hypothetical protein
MSSKKVAAFGVDEYVIKVKPSGFITLDSSVTVSGDLLVEGTTTTIESSDLIISDNTITLNSGDTGYPEPAGGIFLRNAGLIINRGNRPDALLLFDETKVFKDSQTGSQTSGVYTFANDNNDLVGIYTNFIGTYNSDNLILLGSGPTGSGAITSVVTVSGTTDYEKQVFPYTGSNITPNPSNPDSLSNPNDDDIIPNIKSVKDYVKAYASYNFPYKLDKPLGDTEVEVSDLAAGDAISKITFTVDGLVKATVFSNRIELNSISISSNTISSTVTNQDIIVSPNGTGIVQVDTHFNLTNQTEPSTPGDGVTVYADAEGDGGTGIYFKNDTGTSDELVSRNKALLYSIIF